MKRWGLGYQQELAARFPRLIHCRISGFGVSGPLGGLPGYDAVGQAMTRLMSINGDPSQGPTRMGVPVVDLTPGRYTTIGILMALQERSRSGAGQYLDMTLYDCGMALLHPHAANCFLNGAPPVPLGNSHPNIVPCDRFSTRTGEIFVVGGNEGQFRKLAIELGLPEIAQDPRFADNASRLKHKAGTDRAADRGAARYRWRNPVHAAARSGRAGGSGAVHRSGPCRSAARSGSVAKTWPSALPASGAAFCASPKLRHPIWHPRLRHLAGVGAPAHGRWPARYDHRCGIGSHGHARNFSRKHADSGALRLVKQGRFK